jgi:hypothetical protein
MKPRGLPIQGNPHGLRLDVSQVYFPGRHTHGSAGFLTSPGDAGFQVHQAGNIRELVLKKRQVLERQRLSLHGEIHGFFIVLGPGSFRGEVQLFFAHGHEEFLDRPLLRLFRKNAFQPVAFVDDGRHLHLLLAEPDVVLDGIIHRLVAQLAGKVHPADQGNNGFFQGAAHAHFLFPLAPQRRHAQGLGQLLRVHRVQDRRQGDWRGRVPRQRHETLGRQCPAVQFPLGFRQRENAFPVIRLQGQGVQLSPSDLGSSQLRRCFHKRVLHRSLHRQLRATGAGDFEVFRLEDLREKARKKQAVGRGFHGNRAVVERDGSRGVEQGLPDPETRHGGHAQLGGTDEEPALDVAEGQAQRIGRPHDGRLQSGLGVEP